MLECGHYISKTSVTSKNLLITQYLTGLEDIFYIFINGIYFMQTTLQLQGALL